MKENMWISRKYWGNSLYIFAIPSLLSIVTFIVYFPSLWYGFIFDDLPTITNYIHNKALDIKGQLFANPRWISRILNQWTHQNWGNNPFAYRIINLSMHLFIGVMIFALLWRLFKYVDKSSFLYKHALLLSTLTSMLFLLHPVQTQTVTYITQMRLEGLVVLFSTAAILCFVYAATTAKWTLRRVLYGVLFVLMAFSAGTKEIIIVLPVLLVLVDWFFLSDGEWSRFKPRIWVHICCSIILYGIMLKYGLLKPHYVTAIVTSPLHNNRGNILTGSAHEDIMWYSFALSQFKVMLHYLGIFFWPFNLSFDYDVKLVQHWYSLDVIGPVALLSMLAYVVVWLYKNSSSKILAFCGSWFLVSMLPRTSIIPSTELICDYKTYLASIGAMLALSFLLVHLAKMVEPYVLELLNSSMGNRVALLGQVVFCLILALVTGCRNHVWSSELVFWENVLKSAPKARIFNNYAAALWDNGRMNEAVDNFHKAIEKDGWYGEPHVNLASIYQLRKDTDKALQHYKRAIEIGEGHPQLFNNLGMLHFDNKSYDTAEYCFKEAIRLRATRGRAHFNLAKLYHIQNRLDEALLYYQKALEEGCRDGDMLYLYGSFCFDTGRYLEASRAFCAIDINFNDTAVKLANCFYALKNYQKSAECFELIYKKNPGNKIYMYNYAQSLLNLGRWDKALPLYRECVKEESIFPYAPLHLVKCLYHTGSMDEAKMVLKQVLGNKQKEDILSDARSLQRELKLV